MILAHHPFLGCSYFDHVVVLLNCLQYTITYILLVGHKIGQSNICNKRKEENYFGIEDKGISEVTILEIKVKMKWNQWT